MEKARLLNGTTVSMISEALARLQEVEDAQQGMVAQLSSLAAQLRKAAQDIDEVVGSISGHIRDYDDLDLLPLDELAKVVARVKSTTHEDGVSITEFAFALKIAKPSLRDKILATVVGDQKEIIEEEMGRKIQLSVATQAANKIVRIARALQEKGEIGIIARNAPVMDAELT